MGPTLSDLEALARQAGDILRGGYGKSHQVDHKGIIDLVTEVDHRSEKFLLEQIQSCYPSHRVIAEESGQKFGEDCCVWYIDPLDGTVNYAHGVPIFAVSLAYQEEGVMRLGVVYDPMHDECFSATLSEGAWLNGQPIQVSDTRELDNSLLVTGFPYDIRTNPANNLDHFSRFTQITQGVRRLGSAALDLSYVAAGRFDGFWELRLGAWDVAAGALVVQEAGGVVTNLYGQPDYLSAPQSIIAANPYLHPRILSELSRGS